MTDIEGINLVIYIVHIQDEMRVKLKEEVNVVIFSNNKIWFAFVWKWN
jgi:hypothetical protein